MAKKVLVTWSASHEAILGLTFEEDVNIEEFEKAVDDYLTEPTAIDSTPLGEVPQEPTKGSIRPGWIRGPYGMNMMYRT